MKRLREGLTEAVFVRVCLRPNDLGDLLIAKLMNSEYGYGQGYGTSLRTSVDRCSAKPILILYFFNCLFYEYFQGRAAVINFCEGVAPSVRMKRLSSQVARQVALR